MWAPVRIISGEEMWTWWLAKAIAARVRASVFQNKRDAMMGIAWYMVHRNHCQPRVPCQADCILVRNSFTVLEELEEEVIEDREEKKTEEVEVTGKGKQNNRLQQNQAILAAALSTVPAARMRAPRRSCARTTWTRGMWPATALPRSSRSTRSAAPDRASA